MGQVPHVEATDQPTDITAGLTDGCYVAQVGGSGGGSQSIFAVLYATADRPPASDSDYFRAVLGAFFTFIVGYGQPPTWVKTSPTADFPIPVALAAL